MTTPHVTAPASDEDATTGRVYDVAGEDWDAVVADNADRTTNEQIVVNMGRSTRQRTACSGWS